ncbi:MAG: phosphocholine cytidylyltransferase family protein [Burkholderia sp.]|nr:MAG: hypothetical protein E5299_00634 [Burkholderia gladioli]
MRAIILAAGLGLRLQLSSETQYPKCLLCFDEVSLLERHLRVLETLGVTEIMLALGFLHEKVEAELARLGRQPQIVLNPRFDLGSMLTVHTATEALTSGGNVLLMDADVLYDDSIMQALIENPDQAIDRLLIARDFEAGDEPVKLCVKDGVPVELRKQLAVDLQYDTIGESVGFFRFSESTACRLAEIVSGYVHCGRANLPHEEAVRDLLLEGGSNFDVADVTGAPWIEIDFQNDVARARDEVLPLIQRNTVGAAR